jgi:hypothetical protein
LPGRLVIHRSQRRVKHILCGENKDKPPHRRHSSRQSICKAVDSIGAQGRQSSAGQKACTGLAWKDVAVTL